MKKLAKSTLSLCLCLCMLAGAVGVVSAAADSPSDAVYADQWEYKVDESGVGYYQLDAVYCTKPVLESAQHLVIYAPAAYMQQNADGTISVNPNGTVVSSTGVVYTEESAPIVIHNTSGGYTSSKIQPVDLTYLQEGYIHVTIATRGKDTTNDDGEYIGQFPVLIADMKAGIRFLKYFDAELPGNSNRIISRGYSSGGAVSAMLGASGNSPIFDSYLEEIGAYDASDDIFIALCSAPITNLSSADASYEWYQYANDTYFLFNSMAYDRLGNQLENFPVGPQNKYPLGSNILGGTHEDELSTLLYNWYVQYVQNLGLDLGDDGRSGAFYDGFAQIYSDALTEFIARYDELKTEKMPDTVSEYLESLGSGWFTYDEQTGVATIHSLDDVVKNHIARKKMCPSLDSYNYKSNENDAFKAADGTTVHFSPTVRDALKTLLDDAASYGWTEEELTYITDLYNDYAAGVTDESAAMLEVMSPINYVVDKEGFQADLAPYWRLRVGSEDGDHGAPAAWLIAQGLEKYHPEVDVSVGIAWGMGHSLAELTEQDLYDYVADIMLQEDGLTTASFRDVAPGDACYQAVEYVYAQGLMSGDGSGLFDPDATLNRAMLAQILYNNEGRPAVSGVSSDAWYANAVAWASASGVISRYETGMFGPGDVVTYGELTDILTRYAQSKGLDAGAVTSDAQSADAVATRADAAVILARLLQANGSV
jgi:hypothetical protein